MTEANNKMSLTQLNFMLQKLNTADRLDSCARLSLFRIFICALFTFYNLMVLSNQSPRERQIELERYICSNNV